MKTSQIFLFVALIATQLPLFAQTPPTPTLTCTIKSPLNPPSGTPVSYDVSNVGWLMMNVLIDTKGGGKVEGSGAVAINPTGTLPPTYLVITATNSSGTSVPVNAKITSDLGGTGGYGITFFLPEDETTRTSKIQAWIDHIKATDTTSPAAAKTYISNNNSQTVAAMSKIYTQSQVGAFTITVTYVSTGSGLWNGSVQSAPIIANVTNQGDQLDSLH